MNINYCIVGGNLVRDPELRYTPQGVAVCEFTVAINKKIKGEEQASFIGCVAWQKTAELIAERFKKGQRIVAEGELKQERWEDGEGKKRDKTKVNVFKIHFVEKLTGSADGRAAGPDEPGQEEVPF